MVPAGDLFIGGLTAPVSQIIVESFYNFLLFRWLADYSSRGDPALLGSLVEVPVANEILMCILSKFPKLVIRKVGRSLHSLQILPDGQIFVFLVRSSVPERQGVYVGSLAAAEPKRLLATPYAASYAAGSSCGCSGYLFYLEAGVLTMQPFDPKRLVFSAAPFVLAHVSQRDNRAFMSVADDTVLVYAAPHEEDATLAWRDRAGNIAGPRISIRASMHLSMAPDERRAAVYAVDDRTGSGDV